MKRKLLVVILALTFVLSSFSIALADNRVEKDLDRKPLDAVITLCQVGYDGIYGGGITWTFKEIIRFWAGGSQLTIEYDWVPSNANIQDDPKDWDIVFDRYTGLVNAINMHNLPTPSEFDPNVWLWWRDPLTNNYAAANVWDLSYSFEGVGIGLDAEQTGATVWDLNRFLNIPQIKTPLTASAARANKAANELLILWSRWYNLRAGSQRDVIPGFPGIIKWQNPGQMALDLAEQEVAAFAWGPGGWVQATTYATNLTDYERAALSVLASDICAEPWLLMSENVRFVDSIKPSVTVKQVGNVILTITEQSPTKVTFNDMRANGGRGAVGGVLLAHETYPSQGFRKVLAYNEGLGAVAGTDAYYNDAARDAHVAGHHSAHTPLYAIPWFLSAGGPAVAAATGRHFAPSLAAAFDLRYDITDPGSLVAFVMSTPYVTRYPISPGDSFTYYYNPTIVYDVKYQNDLVYGDYVTAFDGEDVLRQDWGAHFFDNIKVGKAGNLNANFDFNTIPWYTQAAWSHENSRLSEFKFFLLDIMENNFGDLNTIVLNSFHGEFASQYQWVYINAPYNTPIYENTLVIKAETSTPGVTLALDGSNIVATYETISAGAINWTLEAFDRNMHLVFLASNIDKYPSSNLKHTVINKFADKDLRLYADFTRWDDESLENLRRPIKEYNTTKLDVVTAKKGTVNLNGDYLNTGYDKYHITGLVSYAGQNYIVTQPVTFQQNPTKAVAVKVGKPKDLRVGASDKMDIVFDPAGAIWDGKLVFESLTPELCTVDADGVVTALKAAGAIKPVILVTGVDMKGAALQYSDGKAADLDGKLKIEITISTEAPLYWKNAIIVGEWASIYKKADATAESWGSVAPGTIITYSSDTKIVNGFLEVLHNNEKAYINMKSISFETDPIAPPSEGGTGESSDGVAAVVTTKGGKLNVRSAPNGSVVSQLANGTAVLVYEISGSWSRIGEGQWVASNYLR